MVVAAFAERAKASRAREQQGTVARRVTANVAVGTVTLAPPMGHSMVAIDAMLGEARAAVAAREAAREAATSTAVSEGGKRRRVILRRGVVRTRE